MLQHTISFIDTKTNKQLELWEPENNIFHVEISHDGARIYYGLTKKEAQKLISFFQSYLNNK